MNMKRRGFLGLLALLPAVPMLLKETLLEQPTPAVVAPPKDPGYLSWYGMPLEADGKWHRYEVTRRDDVEKMFVDGHLVHVRRNGTTDIVLPDVFRGHVKNFELMLPQAEAHAVCWPDHVWTG